MSNELPLLPQSFTILSRLQSGTEEVVPLDLVREYGRACERAAYERAAKECEEFEDELQTHGRDREADVAWRLARRIEALGADK